MMKRFGILTSGGDTPGLNAAIRAIGKHLLHRCDCELIGIRDGFRGLYENRVTTLDDAALSGIITRGGTILGSSRDKPHRMPVNGVETDVTAICVRNIEKNGLDGLFCLGGGGTQKNSFRLHSEGVPVITLPKTIDNDIINTDTSFGFDTGMMIATEAIDRLHSTAHSHHRIIIVETMGHNVGWLALGAGLAGGADVILLPEIPYDEEVIADSIIARTRQGKRFSIVAIAEGSMPVSRYAKFRRRVLEKIKPDASEDVVAKKVAILNDAYRNRNSAILGKKLEKLTGKDARVTILGHLQRGGSPTAYDRLLATNIGSRSVIEALEGNWGNMIAVKGNSLETVPLESVVTSKKYIPVDHPWLATAASLGISLGSSSLTPKEQQEV